MIEWTLNIAETFGDTLEKKDGPTIQRRPNCGVPGWLLKKRTKINVCWWSGSVFALRSAWRWKDPCQSDWGCHEGFRPGLLTFLPFQGYFLIQSSSWSWQIITLQKFSLEPDRKRGKEACGRTQSRRQGHLRGLPPHYAGKRTFQRLYLFMYSRPKTIRLLKAICSRRSTDTSDDFIEGLRHFDKVIVFFKSLPEWRSAGWQWVHQLCRAPPPADHPWREVEWWGGRAAAGWTWGQQGISLFDLPSFQFTVHFNRHFIQLVPPSIV